MAILWGKKRVCWLMHLGKCTAIKHARRARRHFVSFALALDCYLLAAASNSILRLEVRLLGGAEERADWVWLSCFWIVIRMACGGG